MVRIELGREAVTTIFLGSGCPNKNRNGNENGNGNGNGNGNEAARGKQRCGKDCQPDGAGQLGQRCPQQATGRRQFDV